MASSKEYLDYVLDCLRDCSEVSWRAMMGEYVLYCRGRVFGGIYDDRFLVKNVPSAARMMPNAVLQLPYEGAKPMLQVESDESEFLRDLLDSMYQELPPPKKRKNKS